MGKRKIAIVICLAIALICVIVIGAFLRTVNLTVGNNDPTKVSNTHVHTYLTEAVSATCSYGGYILHICDCGDFYKSNECEPLNHEYSAWEIIQAATADNEGIKAQRCLYCNKCNTESIPKVEEHKHIYEDQIILPTCIDRGYTLHACTICDYIVADTETDALGHSWSSWKVTTAATSTSTGTKTRSCKICGESENATIPKVTQSHTHTYTKTVVAPTCTEKGYTLHSCDCGKSYTSDETSKRGHLYGDWETTKQPTSASTGERQCTCTRCGHVNTESIPKLNSGNANQSQSYIDPKIEVTRNGSGAVSYFYYPVGVVDSRTWGDPPTIRISDNGGFRITYYQKDGTKVSCSLDPVEGYINRLVILDNGSYTTRLIGDYSD